MGAGIGARTGGGGGGGGGEGGAEDADKDCEAWGSAENNAPTEGKDTLPRKYVCMKSNIQGQCVHMKKRIMMIPRLALLKQQCENAQSMQKKNQYAPTYHCWWQ